MKFTETLLQGAYLIELEPNFDFRGYFARSYCQREFSEHGLTFNPVQTNFSYSKKKGTLRGMHFQLAPYEETKLISCVWGAVYDVMVDIRPGSPTLNRWFGVELTPDNYKMVYVPAGFAHGFQTLVDNSTILYMISEFYNKEYASGVKWDDPKFGIKWPKVTKRILSEQDR